MRRTQPEQIWSAIGRIDQRNLVRHLHNPINQARSHCRGCAKRLVDTAEGLCNHAVYRLVIEAGASQSGVDQKFGNRFDRYARHPGNLAYGRSLAEQLEDLDAGLQGHLSMPRSFELMLSVKYMFKVTTSDTQAHADISCLPHKLRAVFGSIV